MTRMNTQIKVYCVNIAQDITIDGGETLSGIYARIADRIPFKPIVARVNNKTEDLTYRVYNPKQIEFLSRESATGRRAYTRSLCMMLFHALRQCYPGTRLCIEHSVSHGYYCSFSGPIEVNAHSISRLRDCMREISKAGIPFGHHEEPSDKVREDFRREGLDDKVLLMDTAPSLYTVYYTLGDTADSYYGRLAPSTDHIDVFDLIPYKDGALLLPFDPVHSDRPATPIPQEKMFEAFTRHLEFNNVIGVSNVGQLNSAVSRRHTADLINVAEALHDKHIASIADEIRARYDRGGARIVLIAGPSSSGKTTTAKRLSIYLMTNLLKPQMISLDNYFVNREDTPRDATGDYDYESLHALDLTKFNDDLNALIRGEEVTMPTYNFELGKREYRGDTLRLGSRSILLIEGIHGLNPELTAQIEERMKFRVYVSALTSLSIDDHNWVPTTDNRLLRRIIRDHKYRGTSAVETLRRWSSVRRGEERWIFPYQENADATFNSSLIFELGVMKDYADALLREVPDSRPEYGEAYRLRKFLSYFHSIGVETLPPTSLLREFLGGSSFRY